MLFSLIKKDFLRNKTINIILILFLTLSSFLMVSGAIVIMKQVGAINNIFEIAKPPHFLQMHSGEIDQDKIDEFSNNNDLAKVEQTVEMLNIDGASIWYHNQDKNEEISMSDNVMDNGFVSQNDSFDYLLDLNNNIIQVNKSEIAVPISYMKQYNLKVGDKLSLKDGSYSKEFKICNFIRDAQMGSSMASSIRFLVNDDDLKDMKGSIGEVEYIVEYELKDGGDASKFQKMYEADEAGMPKNGQAITYTLIKLVDCFASGIMAVVIILVSIVLILIAMLNLRFTILETLEEEIKEIANMKAIGISSKDIRKLYLTKYKVITILSCILGFILALLCGSKLTSNISMNFGEKQLTYKSILVLILLLFLVYSFVVHFCKKILRRIERINIVQALAGSGYESIKKRKHSKNRKDKFTLEKNNIFSVDMFLCFRDLFIKKKSWALLLIVYMLATCIIVIPINLLNTFNSQSFVKYMGTALSDIRIDLLTKDEVQQKYKSMMKVLKSTEGIDKFNVYSIFNYEVHNDEEDKFDALKVECGDYKTFNVSYLKGKGPEKDGEIALSVLNAKQLNKEVGSTIELRMHGQEKECTVCGIYQDVTSGGYTSKMINGDDLNASSYKVFINVNNKGDIEKIKSSISEELPYAKVILMQEYISQTLGTITTSLAKVVLIAIIMSIAIVTLITALFLKLQGTKDYSYVAILKAIGFSVNDIRKQLVVKNLIVSFIGIVLGLIISNTVGQSFVGVLISACNIGLSKIAFVINPVEIFILCPIILLLTALLANWICSSSVKKYNIVEMINE